MPSTTVRTGMVFILWAAMAALAQSAEPTPDAGLSRPAPKIQDAVDYAPATPTPLDNAADEFSSLLDPKAKSKAAEEKPSPTVTFAAPTMPPLPSASAAPQAESKLDTPPAGPLTEQPPAQETKVAALPLSPASTSGGLQLRPPSQSSPGLTPAKGRGMPPLATVLASLAVVVGLFLIVAWTMSKTAGAAAVRLPNEVVETLGHAPLTARQQVHLLRCGNKLLLVSVTPGGAETLTEITDQEEVQRLASLCRQRQPGSSTAAFRQVIQQYVAEDADES
jgi:flagellar biogenesis protein FliO